MSYNRIILQGNLTRDIEIRHINGNTAVGGFGIATNRKYKTAAGEQREDVCFVDCKAWGKTAEIMCQYLSRGSSVLIEGRLELETWDDKNGGGKRSKHVVVVDNFTFTGGKQEGGRQQSKPEYQRQGAAAPIDHDDIPF